MLDKQKLLKTLKQRKARHHYCMLICTKYNLTEYKGLTYEQHMMGCIDYIEIIKEIETGEYDISTSPQTNTDK